MNRPTPASTTGLSRRTALGSAGMLAAGLAMGPSRPLVAAHAATPGALPSLIAAYYAGWSAHDDGSQLAALFTDDGIYEDVPAGLTLRGPGEIAGYVAGNFAGFPDLAYEVRSGFVAGDWAATEWVYVGTYTGTYPGLPAGTGQRVRLPGADVLELRGAKITRVGSYYDLSTFLTQLGMLPASGAATPAATPSQ